MGVSLNDGISKKTYLGLPCDLKYPTIDRVTRNFFDMSRKSQETIWLFRKDLDRAFRQIYAEPISVPLLGYRWRNLYYFDLVLVMGCRIAPYICQRTTDMLVYLHQKQEYFLLNYIDDFLGLEYQSKIYQSHADFIDLLSKLAVDQSERKSVTPSQIIEFVGNIINTIDMTLSVMAQRKIEVLHELETWRNREACTRRQLESLIGKLQFMSNCIKPGRLFVSRLLNEMKKMKRDKYYHVNKELRKDIKWWYLFLPGYKGTSIMWLLEVETIDSELATDACLLGAGAIRNQQYFHTKFPDWFVTDEMRIPHFELWAIIMAVRLWGSELSGTIIRIRTDNEAVAQIVNTGRSQDLLLQKMLRELCWRLARFEFRVKTVFLEGRFNTLPDLLSRWHEGPHIRETFYNMGGHEMKQCYVTANMFKFSHDW